MFVIAKWVTVVNRKKPIKDIFMRLPLYPALGRGHLSD